MLDIVKEASGFNVPIFEANRKLVAKSNGGLKYPSALVFHAYWGGKQAESVKKSFVYPSRSDVQRPDSEEDIAFMSVRSLYLCVYRFASSLWSISLINRFDLIFLYHL